MANMIQTTTGADLLSGNDAAMADNMLIMPELQKLGSVYQSRFVQYENDRRIQELKWMRNLRQWLGEYDPEVLSMLGPQRSRAYPKITRVKVLSMVARLMNLLFPVSEKNWGIKASPIPNLPPDVLAEAADKVLAALPAAADSIGTGQPLPPEVDNQLTIAIREIAGKRAARLELVVEDQFAELGGTKDVDYIMLCRSVLMSGVLYSMGVLRGPFVRTVQESFWSRDPMDPSRITVSLRLAYKPQFQVVNMWDYYPDMAARSFDEMDGQFERHVMSRHQLRQLAKRPDFFGEVIDTYLQSNQTGNYKMRPFETDLKTAGVAVNVNFNAGRKYELIEWTGFESAHTLAQAGFSIPSEQMSGEVEINMWLLDDKVVKAQLSPWADMGEERVKMYHQFVYEKDDTSLTGNGLPNVIRDSQMSIAAAARMSLDNGGITSGPQLEVNTKLLRADQDLGSVAPYKIWYRDDDAPTAQFPAVREIKIDSHLGELKALVEMFSNFADQESFINPGTGGDIQKMPSEPFRNAAGASMIRGDLALPFKDAVRNFDGFTLSVVNSMIAFNRQFNPDPEIKGDFAPVARGSSSLIAKEVRGIQMDTFVQTLSPQETPYIKGYNLLLERARVRDLPVQDIIVNKEEAELIEQQQAQQASRDADDQARLIEATIKKLLGDMLKTLTQADKNQTAAEAQQALTTMEVLERGLNAGGQGAGTTVGGKFGGGGGNSAGAGSPAAGKAKRS